jgi:hypothetical protein
MFGPELCVQAELRLLTCGGWSSNEVCVPRHLAHQPFENSSAIYNGYLILDLEILQI